MNYLCFYSLGVFFETVLNYKNYKPKLRTEYCCPFKVTTVSVMGRIFFSLTLVQQSANTGRLSWLPSKATMPNSLQRSWSPLPTWNSGNSSLPPIRRKQSGYTSGWVRGCCPWGLTANGFSKLNADSAQGPLPEIFVAYQKHIYGLYYMWVYWLRKHFSAVSWEWRSLESFGVQTANFTFLLCHLLAMWPLVTYSPLSAQYSYL